MTPRTAFGRKFATMQGSFTTPDDEISNRLEEAYDLFLIGKTEAALSLLDQLSIERSSPLFIRSIAVKSSCFVAQGDLARASKLLSGVPANTPFDRELKILRAVIDVRRRALEPAMSAFMDTAAAQAKTQPNFDLERIADELTRERPLVKPLEADALEPAVNAVSNEHSSEAVIASETLANIMLGQGKLTDAQKLFIRLAREQPDKFEYYKTKIDAISQLIPKP